MLESSRLPIGSAFAIGLVILVGSFPSLAQTTFATVTGTVTDAGGAVVAKADIEATQLGTNYTYKAQSNEVGNYTLGQLREGEYTLRVSAPGFNPFEAKEIRLVARDVRRIDVALTVGTVQSSVE